jgi:hypothetical protein
VTAPWRKRLILVAVALLALAGAFVAGRYSRPARVEERTKVETRWHVHVMWWEHRIETAKTAERRNVRTTRIEAPGGVVTTVTEDRTEVDTDSHTEIAAGGGATEQGERSVVTERVETDRPRWAVEGGWRLFPEPDPVPVDLSLQYRIFGPLWLGAGPTHDREGWGGRVAARLEL